MTASIHQRGRLRAQGVRTRNAIVGAARDLLLECGGLEFTLREIALRAGVSISNLQYYFPTKVAVLRAVFEPVVEACVRDLRHAVAAGTSPRHTLTSVLAGVLRDAQSVENARLWCHFPSLVALHRETAQLLDEWYGTLTEELATLVHAINPAFTQAECIEIATLLIAIVDGVIMRSGTGTGTHDGAFVHALDTTFLATVDSLLCGRIPRP
jgi:AcrR family transcriptional regulator